MTDLKRIIDLTFIAARYGTPDPTADLNKDGIVIILDVSIAARRFGR